MKNTEQIEVAKFNAIQTIINRNDTHLSSYPEDQKVVDKVAKQLSRLSPDVVNYILMSMNTNYLNKDNQRLDIRKSNNSDFTYRGTLCINNYSIVDIYFNRFDFITDGLVLSISDDKPIAILEKIAYRFIKED